MSYSKKDTAKKEGISYICKGTYVHPNWNQKVSGDILFWKNKSVESAEFLVAKYFDRTFFFRGQFYRVFLQILQGWIARKNFAVETNWTH